MKKNREVINKVILSLILGVLTTACGLNSTDDQKLVASQARGSRAGNVLIDGSKKAIDLPISRPALTSLKWTEVYTTELNLENFLSLTEGQRVDIPTNMIADIDTYIWGSIKSRSSGVQFGNIQSEEDFFENVDTQSFQFELSIWDSLTGGTNTQTNEKIDFVGYAYFGRTGNTQVGALTTVVYQNFSNFARVGLKFTDSVGDIVVEADINRSSKTMNGYVFFRKGTSGALSTLGSFSNNACQLFTCVN